MTKHLMNLFGCGLAAAAIAAIGEFAVSVPAVAQAPDARPDLAVAAAAGKATIARMEKEPAAWKTATTLPGDVRVITETIGTPTERRIILRIDSPGGAAEILRVIVKDGVWYAVEGQKAGKYRPYEVPFKLPTAYFFLTRSEPQCVVDPQGDLGAFERPEGEVATYRTPLPEAQQTQIKAMLEASEAAIQKNPEAAKNPGFKNSLATFRDLVDHGIPTKLNVRTGMILQFGIAERQTRITEFQFLDKLDPRVVGTEGRSWYDFTSDPTEGNLNDLVMISHNGMWQPGMKTHDTDGRLLNVATGQVRRIPYHGATAIPGCFLKDRSHVIISGLDSIDGSMSLVEVDLKTGDNRKVGGEALASGITLQPTLSPEGRFLAAIHADGAEKRLYLVDLLNDQSRPIGPPSDCSFLSWLPNGNELLLMLQEQLDPAAPVSEQINTIARIDLDGKLKRIGEGEFPLLLNDGATILFRDVKSSLWKTCNLDGGDLKPFADGLRDYGFPSLAPDGKRIMMMKFQQDAAPRPFIVSIGSGDVAPATQEPGFWAMPSWR